MISKLNIFVKYFLPLFLFVFLFSPTSFSAVLQLQKIGTLDLGGNTYSEWWYTGVNPIFYGVGAPNTKVDIKIADSLYSVTSGTNGTWSYASAMEKGDYSVEISQGAEKILFTLHLGQMLPEKIPAGTQESTTANGVPSTGFNQYVALSMGAGVILLATYFYFSTDSKKKTVFENRMIKED